MERSYISLKDTYTSVIIQQKDKLQVTNLNSPNLM